MIFFLLMKKGRVDRPNWLINGFRQAVQDVRLLDISMEGYSFTWFKSLGTDRAVEEKLDRAMANIVWGTLFPNAKLECLTAASSDHYPILLCCENITAHMMRKRFKFDAWLTEPGFKDFVCGQWINNEHEDMINKLDACG
ncbi:unnamed protein product [Vicia faba]|uniref:Uncharacterized protein n=1 Tax=Vicia faba TaxID=3906 RepID=A0AAV1A0P0_VICFA|nr:unnamed protein product [Vicia faba]